MSSVTTTSLWSGEFWVGRKSFWSDVTSFWSEVTGNCGTYLQKVVGNALQMRRRQSTSTTHRTSKTLNGQLTRSVRLSLKYNIKRVRRASPTRGICPKPPASLVSTTNLERRSVALELRPRHREKMQLLQMRPHKPRAIISCRLPMFLGS